MSQDIKYKVIKRHISIIKAGDIVVINGELKKVGKNDIKYSSFMGITLFGDCYQLGYKLVDVALIYHCKPKLFNQR